MSCKGCKNCTCKSVIDWVSEITDADDTSRGLIVLEDGTNQKDSYLRYQDGEIVGGMGVELEDYDQKVEQVEVSNNPCDDRVINYVLHIRG